MVSEEGFLGDARLGSQRAVVPAYVHLEGDRLVWSYLHLEEHWHEADPKGMLDAFVRIQDGAGALRFALRYGVLGICEHGLPATHNPPPLEPRGTGIAATWCYPLGWRKSLCWEPLDRWFHFAGQARAMIAIAANLRQDKPGLANDWLAVFAAHPRQKVDALCQRLGQSVEAGRFYIRSLLLEWLTWGNVRPELNWPVLQQSPSLSFTGGTFGLLGVQMLFAIAAAHSIALCSGCGTPYLRKHKPRPDRRNFCPSCGKEVASRLRQRDWQRKHEKGTSND